MTEKQQAAIASQEELLRKLHFILHKIESRKAEVIAAYSAASDQEKKNVALAAWSASPDYSQCADPNVPRLGEELRVLAATAEYLRAVEIPACERLLVAERKYADELIEIDREYPVQAMETVVN